MSAKQATIYDVAAAAGVAIKTVSRVINEEPGVSEATRQRVRAAVADLSYRPNREARSLASAQSYFVALVFDESAPQSVIEVQDGIVAASGDRRHLIAEAVGGGDRAILESIDSLLASSKPDCLILLPPVSDNEAVLARLDQAGARYARLSTVAMACAGEQILLDDRKAAAMMVEHLVATGRRRIALVRASAAAVSGDLRLQGYLDGLRAASIEPDPLLIEDGDGSFSSGMHAASMLLAQGERPDAIFAATDDMALGVASVAGRLGIRVPEDIGVCGFGRSHLAQLVWPTLTTVGHPLNTMSQVAIAKLLHDVSGELADPVARTELAPVLVVGGTTQARLSTATTIGS